MKYTEIKGDLFSAEEHYVLAHCIAADARMGAGIATQFVKRYPNMRNYIHSQNPIIGDVVFYNCHQAGGTGKHHLFNLITKEKSWEKPYRADFSNAIDKLKEEMVNRGFLHLAIPLIGAGLDRLDWNESRDYIKEEFADTDIEILVHKL